MPEIITDRDLRHGIESCVKLAKKFVFIVSPYIDLDDDIKKAFSFLKPEVKKTVVYREADGSNIKSGITDDDSRNFLNSLPNIELVAVKNLHAKFFMNEEFTIISTMNLTSSSNHNYEIGVEIRNEDDYEMFMDCLNYLIYDIIDGDDSNMDRERLKNIIPKQLFVLEYNAKGAKINSEQIDIETFKSLHKNCNVKHGFCIRCESTNIEFYTKTPLCPKCFKEWSIYKNPTYEEKCCHRCGIEVNSTIDDALCDNCEEVYKFEIEREWKKLQVKDKTHNRVNSK